MTAEAPTQAPILHETVIQRLVLPPGDDGSRLPLYIECTEGAPRIAELVRDRRGMVVPPGQHFSFASYFNAFPASYWRRWTIVSTVELRVMVAGAATVTVYRSNSRGNPQRVASEQSGNRFGYLSFELPLAPFGDGGWYWFEISGGHDESSLEWAEWVVSTERPAQGRVTVAITTFNRPADCVGLLQSLVDAEETMERIDRIAVVDQGNQNVEDHPDFDRVARRARKKIDVLRQPNLGGSGGFARGMYEAAHRGDSGYVLLLDDDVLVEPEGLLRGLAFQDLVRQDLIVGGHMLNMFMPSMLHSFGEKVNRYKFMWGPAPHTEEAHDFAEDTLRETEWMHRRIDVDYNGWWMCLIPTKVVRQLGLALPVFIKWDDAEFGLRAQDAGIPTVSLPGMAVWHVPWTDKDDTTDWQAYYHARNRILMALLHSPYNRGGDLLRHSMMVQVKHGLAMEYSAAELRLWALEDILSGPDHLHRDLGSKLGEVRAFRADQDDAKVITDPMGFPAVKRLKPPKKGKEPTAPRGPVGRVLTAAVGAARQLREPKPTSRRNPEAAVPAMDARWWLLSQFDSAVVSTADGLGAAWYKRDRDRFNDIMKRSVLLHQELLVGWNDLAEQYRGVVDDVTSPEAWFSTWGLEAE
jgi:galactofuranosylgalactofuranosylrhamnosyl-N-acetylglucosaminyl-diphospho-decaprenol beta-1,5/1,6-galactofuranosyltransferase